MRKIVRSIPDLHTYRGIDPRVASAYRARVIAKYLIQRANFRPEEMRGLAGLAASRLGRDALVVAGGPSVRLLDIQKVLRAQAGGMDVFAMNMYAQSEIARQVRPNYYCLSDPAFFEGDSRCESASVRQVWDFVRETRARAVVPVGAKLPDGGTSELRFNNLGLEGWSRNIDPMRPRGYSSMVAFSSLSVALYLGYSTVYIAGLDNSQFRQLRRDETGKLRYASGTHHHPTDWSDYEIGQVGDRNIYRGGIAAYFEDVARIFAEARLFPRNRVAHIDGETLFDSFRPMGPHDLDIRVESA